jgi:D-alanyl-D-alanine carboxypeptidase
MTERAKELGAENTNFVNPSGLYDENHKTSAKDLALIMREITKHAEFLEIASTFSYKVPPTNKHLEGIHLANENKLVNKNSMYYYPLAEAGKTGYTVKSLHSYVASASNNGQRLIVALIHDKEKKFYVDSKSLFEYGFNNFELKQLYKKDDVVTTYINEGLNIPLLAQDDYYYIKEKASTAEPKAEIINSPLQDKSFKKGDSIMEASIIFENKSLRNLKLVSGVDHEAKSTFGISFDSGDSSKNSGYTLQIFSAALVIVIIAVFGVIKYKHKK